jgi:Rrf2 family protein
MIKISEAVNLAFQAMLVLSQSREGDRQSVSRLAESLKASQSHLAKIMLRLCKCGLVRSKRGPKGGFHLAKSPLSTTLLEIYEAIEGPLAENVRVLDLPWGYAWTGNLSGLLSEHFSTTTLASIATENKQDS